MKVVTHRLLKKAQDREVERKKMMMKEIHSIYYMVLTILITTNNNNNIQIAIGFFTNQNVSITNSHLYQGAKLSAASGRNSCCNGPEMLFFESPLVATIEMAILVYALL